jgi:hypothetical protein
MTTDEPTTDDEIAFTTDRGADVTVTAEDGALFITVPEHGLTAARATLDRERGQDVLDAGIHRDNSGERFRALIPVGDRRETLAALREASEPAQTDEPLTYEVVEETERLPSLDGWGGDTRTVETLQASKLHAEMTDRQRELARRVDTDRVPDDADVGDALTLDELLDDPRTADEQEQDALEEAAETGEKVIIARSSTGCYDATKECSLDHVTRVATPEGEIETRRTHTY